MPSVLGAAVALDLVQLRRAASTHSSAELLERHSGGVTCMHGLAAGFHFFKAGELSTLVPWPNASRTVYSHDVRTVLARAAQPIVRTLLSRAPGLATAADEFGATPLHLAARFCIDSLVQELLRAGALPLAYAGKRTPVDEAMLSGCHEALGMLLSALAPAAALQQAALDKAVAYVQLPGAALSPRMLQRLVRDHGLPSVGGMSGISRRGPSSIGTPPTADATTAACTEGGGWDVQPPPSEVERASCEIEQVSPGMAAEEYVRRFHDFSRPVLVRAALPLSERCAYAKGAGAMREPWAASTQMRCGRTAYPSLTGQKPCGFFTLHALDTHPVCSDAERTLPVCALKPQGGVNATPSFKRLPVSYRYTDDVPPAPMLSRTWASAGSRQLFAGGRGSGAALHFHNPAYNVQFFGVKRWLLTPPRYSGITGAASTRWDIEPRTSDVLPAELPLRCTQGPGDMLLLPGHWGHATVNAGFNLGIGNLYCDSINANYTHDPTCRRFFPHATGPHESSKAHRRTNLQPILKDALGGNFPPDGNFRWPRGEATRRDMTEQSGAASAGAAALTTPAPAAVPKYKPEPSSWPSVAKSILFGTPSGDPVRRGMLERGAAPLARGRGMPPRGRGSRGRSIGARAPLNVKPVNPDCARGQPAHQPVAFVHINKAGGTAMRARLYTSARHQMLEIHDQAAAGRLRALGSRFFHASASLQRRVLGATAWDSAYTFALVRNPFARQVSMFFFLLQEASCNRPIGVRPPHCEQRQLPAPGPWLNDKAVGVHKFRAWIRAMGTKFPPGSKDAHLFGARSHGNEIDPWFNASQLSWLVDASGRVLVKEVIKLEDLEASWPKLQRGICGFAREAYADEAELKRNPSSHGHYSEYYDDETRRLVEEYMEADLRTFGYRFEKAAAEPEDKDKGRQRQTAKEL